MFDLTDRTSFAALDNWLRQIRMHARSAAPVVLIGTKQDRVDERAVTREEAADFASHHALEYVECSSLSGENVDAAVAEMLHELMKPDADFEAGSRFEQQLAENRARRAETVRKESWWYRWGLSRSTPRGYREETWFGTLTLRQNLARVRGYRRNPVGAAAGLSPCAR